ncbi:glycosyltransferase family 2 protein [Candidatus Beckwithbacteria bacterium]|nr:glycosyltransferase family 2 protein [Candidatus Beckwithbacteria bacterium]
MIKPYLSIIIPAFNEKENFKKGSLDKVARYLKKQKFSFEVLIIDDGSMDGCQEMIAEFCKHNPGFTLIQNKHMGKAGTVTKGVFEAKGEYILFTDFDQATPLDEWVKLETYLQKGYDIVIGSREVAGAKREAEPWYRHWMGRGFNFGVRLLTVGDFADTQCGFKAFKAEVAKKVFKKLQVYKPKEIKAAFTGAFDVEILFIAKRLGYKIAEVPIYWSHVETQRVSPLKDSFKMALDVVKIRFYDLLGRYQ